MTSRPLWVSLLVGIALVASGLSELLQSGAHSTPTSWRWILTAAPDSAGWVWPGLFVLTGITAVLGRAFPSLAKAGFRACSLLYAVWCLVGLWDWSHGGGGNIPGSSASFIITICTWVLADYVSLGVASGRVNDKGALLAEKIEEISNGG